MVIRDHHDGYITWEAYDRNQTVIAGNANMKGAMVPGSVRNGGGLLVGLLRCGHCGRRLKVRAVQRSIHDAHGEDCTDAAEGDAMPSI